MEFLIIILGLILDRITKLWAINQLSRVSEIVVIKNFFSFFYVENRGAAFGIFQNKVGFLTLITLAVMLAIIYYFIKYKPSSKILKISLALIISGAIGNLIDRIYYKYVVDFLTLHYKEIYYFPTFNIADTLVVSGTILLAIYFVREDKNGN